MRGYELMYILDPTLDEDATQALIGQIEGFMAKQGVELQGTEPWGKRRMAYRIGKHWEGAYILSRIQASPQSIAEVERRLRVTEGVLRFLTVRVDKDQAKLERQRTRRAALDAARRQRRGRPAPEGEPDAPAADEIPEARGAEADYDEGYLDENGAAHQRAEVGSGAARRGRRGTRAGEGPGDEAEPVGEAS